MVVILTSTDEAPCHSKLRPRHRLGDRHFVRFVLGPGGPLRFLRCGFWDAMGDAQDLGWTSKKSVQNGYLWLCTMNGAIYGYHWISRLYIYMYTYNIIGYPSSPLASIGYGEPVGATHGYFPQGTKASWVRSANWTCGRSSPFLNWDL
jgi:hypothetical protein